MGTAGTFNGVENLDLRHRPSYLVEIKTGTLAAETATEWDAYIEGRGDATVFHDRRWGEAIHAAYGYEPLYLFVRRDDAVVGVLMLIDVKSPFFGRSLISTAFTVGGGPLADDALALTALADFARAEGEKRNVKYVELRGGAVSKADWRAKDDVYAAYSREIALSDDIELKAVPRKRRAEIRKGLKALDGGDVSMDHAASLETFYQLYAMSVHGLGTPVFGLKFLRALKAAFGDALFFSTVNVGETPVFALATFRFRDRLLPYYAGVTPAARAAKAADLGYFLLMRHGRETGAKFFDFGRSKVGSSHADYKHSWGFEAAPLSYQYALIRADETPNVNPNNPKFAAITAAWKRLPLFAANRIGPILARNLA